MIIQNTSTIQNQQSFSNWMVTNYPVTPYYSYTIYFIILLVVSSVLLFKILFHEKDIKMYDHTTQTIVLCAHVVVLILETYKSFTEYTDNKREHFTNNDLEVILIKANWCPACSMFLKSNVWENVQDQVSTSNITFTTFDIATDDPKRIQSTLKIDPTTIKYVPCIYIRTPDGVFAYQDNIYDTSAMVKVLSSLKNKFTS